MQQLAEIAGQRPDVADVDVGDVAALAARDIDRAADWAVGAAPADYRQLAGTVAKRHLLVGHIHAQNLGGARIGHRLMVVGRVVDIAGVLVLLDPADAVHHAGRAGLDPRPRALVVALVGKQFLATRLAQEFGRERLVGVRVRDFPRLGGVGDVAVGQQHHRSHVLHRDAARLDRAFERIGRAARGDHRQRRIAIATVDGLVKVALLGLGWQAGARPAALGVDDDQRQFGHDRQTHRLGLQRDARTAGRGDAQLPGIARPDGGADRGDFILRLEGGDAEFLQPRKVVQDRGCGRDGIAAEEHRQFRKLRARNQPQRNRLRPGDRAIQPRLAGDGRDIVAARRAGQFRRLAIGVTGVERGDVGLGNFRLLSELVLQPGMDRLTRAAEHPQRQPQRPHVLGPQRILVAQAEGLHRLNRQRTDIESQHVVFGEAAVLQRIGVVLGLVQVALTELAGVGDDQAAGLQGCEVHLQRRRVHRDQHVRRVARRVDFARTEIDLEGGDAEQRALRRADLGRKVREGGKVVARQCGRQGELPAGQLHPVAGIPGKADDHRLLFARGGAGVVGIGGLRGHAKSLGGEAYSASAPMDAPFQRQ